MTRDEFLVRYARQTGHTLVELAARKMRPYRCLCGGAKCTGWRVVHDRYVEMEIAEGYISEDEAAAYEEELGVRYDTQPWIFGATRASRSRSN